MTRILLLVISLLVTVSSQGITKGEYEAIQKSIKQSPFVNIMVAFDSAAPIGPQLHQVLSEFAEKRAGFLKLHFVDCNTNDEEAATKISFCTKQVRSQLPALMYTEPPLNPYTNFEKRRRRTFKEKMYQGSLADKSLYDFAVQLMPLYSTKVNKISDWAQFKSKNKNVPFALFVTEKERISPMYKALTAHFRDTIAFAHTQLSSPLCESLKIKSAPTIIINQNKKVDLVKSLLDQVELLRPHEGGPAEIVIEELAHATPELNITEFNQKVIENDHYVMLHLLGKDGTAHPEWSALKNKFLGMFQYFESDSLAETVGAKTLPAVVYFPKSIAKKNVQKTIFGPKQTLSKIEIEIDNMVEDFTIGVSNDIEMQQQSSLPVFEGKSVAILFHKAQISLPYKVVSNDPSFKKNIVFLRMVNPQKTTTQRLGIKSLPTLMVMSLEPSDIEKVKAQRNNPEEAKKEGNEGGLKFRTAQYNGEYVYDQLYTFLSYFNTSSDQSDKPKEEAAKQSSFQLNDITTVEQYKTACIINSCYLLLYNGEKDAASLTLKAKNQISQIPKHHYGGTVYLIDASCHYDLLPHFKASGDQLPFFVHVLSTKQKFLRLNGLMNKKSISLMVQNVKKGDGIWQPYNNGLFEERDCTQYYQKIEEMASTSAFTEEDAAILEQIKQEEAKRAQQAKQAGSKGTKSGSKKKKKRRRDEDDDQL